MFLPAEVLQEVFNYLDTGHNGLSTLFSCLLVSRDWCSNIVGTLWSKPFYYSNAFSKNPNSYKIIDTYLTCLDEETREDLRNNGVNLPVIFDKPLFNYEIYHKHLHYRTFISCVYLWVQEKSAPNDDNLSELIMKTLLKLFNNKSCKKLQRTLYIMPESNPMFYVQSVQGYLISNVNRIWVDLHVPRFFDLLAKNCKRVEHFGVLMKDVGRFNESGSIDVAKFITEQEALQSFQNIYLTSTQDVIDALKSQAHSLRCIEFICANFQGCYSLDGLAACHNLEILRFKKCYNITVDIISPLLEASFPKLINLSVIETDCDVLHRWAESLCLESDDDFQDERIQFDLNYVRELMLFNKMCHLCNESCIYPLTTACGHTFCKECIFYHLSIYDQCPLKHCRTELSNTKYLYEHPFERNDALISEKRKLDAEKRLLEEMPIYDGHLVFPKMTYTFNVTEMKYHLLIRSCLHSRYRNKFGMLLSSRCEYGTLMEIKQIDFNDERNIRFQAIATDRFKILSSGGTRDGFEIAKVQIIHDEPEEEGKIIDNQPH
ncbi:LON-domain-containing protein [Rhizophagus clarus]|uniref:LON-domain-containing protein n=1 Tax=Rhizophagus clarus TaxID=94130 RepID=A0A8H3LZ29_9GLOM|nr:LON-domain-containing protein [Rhizophagus clarus]